MPIRSVSVSLPSRDCSIAWQLRQLLASATGRATSCTTDVFRQAKTDHMKLALDTNVLVYAEGWGDPARCERARQVVAALDPADVVLPVQVLGELHRVLVGKARRSPQQVRAAILDWSDAYDCVDTQLSAMLAAQDLVADHQLGIWDAVVLATASMAGSRLLLTEDLHPGFTWGGVTVVNPFADPPSPLLAQVAST